MLIELSDKKIKKKYKSMLGLSFENVGKPANRKWKFISKLLCRVLPVIAGAIVSVPINEVLKVWIIFGCTIIVAVVSALSELTTQEIDKG